MAGFESPDPINVIVPKGGFIGEITGMQMIGDRCYVFTDKAVYELKRKSKLRVWLERILNLCGKLSPFYVSLRWRSRR